MTTIEQALRSKLLADATVLGLVSTRVYPLVLPQDPTYPAITYKRVTGRDMTAHDGRLGLDRSRFQIDCLDDDFGGATTLARAVMVALNGYRGTVDTVDIGAIVNESTQDLYDPILEIQKVSIDFWVTYTV